MSDTNEDLARCFPVLASLDINETKAFYRDELGFARTVHEDDDYLILARDEMELHFSLTRNKDLPRESSCYIRGGQIVSLFAEYRVRKIEGLTEFEVQPWNMAEFSVRDPHGNLLRFGAAPEEI